VLNVRNQVKLKLEEASSSLNANIFELLAGAFQHIRQQLYYLILLIEQYKHGK
jgi:ABC-type branched-subunit amino acid transport system ATPase component